MKKRRAAFTLIELLVATVVLMIIMGVLLQLTGTIGTMWRSATGRISTYQTARAAFETVTTQLSQATLNTYFDYTDKDGNYRPIQNMVNINRGNWTPNRFMRTSELHFLCGPAWNSNAQFALAYDSTQLGNPGSAVFFQAPLGFTMDSKLRPLNRTLNSVGFYVQWRSAAETGLLPAWMPNIFGNRSSYQLLQYIQPSEYNSIYDSTMETVDNPLYSGQELVAQRSTYNRNWVTAMQTTRPGIPPPKAAVLAENVLLFVVLPRLAPRDEQLIMNQTGGSSAQFPEGTYLCPDYEYDSRAWMSGYQGGLAGFRRNYMRNQLPPIVDVVMIVADAHSLQRFDMNGTEPPNEIRLTDTGGNPLSFTNSTQLDDEIAAFEAKLIENNIRFRTFRTAVLIRGAKWSNTDF